MSTKKISHSGSALVFACSGAADVGAIADQTARKLTQQGVGQMHCLAGVGGRVAPIMVKTRSAARVLAIDGCDLDCVKKTLERAGISGYQHLRVTDMGLEKGKSSATPERVEMLVTQARAMLRM